MMRPNSEETDCDAFDGGSLRDAWRQQPNTPGYSTDFGQKYPTFKERSAFFRTFNAV